MPWYANSEGRYGASGAKGDLGERIVGEYCNNNNITYIPLTDRISQVTLKIDCYIDDVPVDVKSNYFNEKLVVELYLQKKKPGWLYTTSAVQIYGVDTSTKSIYCYLVEDMIKYVRANKTRATKSKTGDILMYVSINEPFIKKLQ